MHILNTPNCPSMSLQLCENLVCLIKITNELMELKVVNASQETSLATITLNYIKVKRKINELDVLRTWMNKSPPLRAKVVGNPLQMLTIS